MNDPIVIAGASLAGLRAAQALRRGGHDERIVMVGAEHHPPYTRPPLSKDLLAGVSEPADCALGGDDLSLDWELGVAAAGVDLGRRSVALADGSTAAG